MRILSLLLAGMLSGCGFAQHGLRVYGTTTSVDPTTGRQVQKTALLAALNGDAPGLKKLSCGGFKMEFETVNAVQEIPHFDAKTGALLAMETKPIVGGFYTSEVTRAQGEADKMRIDSTSAGATGAGLSFFAPGALGKGASSLGSAFTH